MSCLKNRINTEVQLIVVFIDKKFQKKFDIYTNHVCTPNLVAVYDMQLRNIIITFEIFLMQCYLHVIYMMQIIYGSIPDRCNNFIMKEYVYQFILTLPEVETTSLAVNQYIKRYKRNKEFPEKDGFFFNNWYVYLFQMLAI